MGALTVPKRDEKRSRVFLSADIECGGKVVAARIRDISATGALLESDFAPAQGKTVQVACGKVILQGRVAWVDRCWFGIEFETPLLMSKLVDQSGARLKVSAPRTYRTGELDHQ